MKTNQLKKFRLAAGLTRKQLAKKSRISEIYIRKIEDDGLMPGVDVGVRLANVLGVLAEWIFFRPSSVGRDRLEVFAERHPEIFGGLGFDDVTRIERCLLAMDAKMAAAVLSDKCHWVDAWGTIQLFDRYIMSFPKNKWPKIRRVVNVRKGEVLGVSKLPWLDAEDNV